MSGKCTEETTYRTSIDGRTIDEFHRSISRPKLAGWLLVPEAIFRGSVRITWLATWPIKKLLNIYARGPAFREGVVVNPFNTVDLYPLMSKLLGINPRPNNGSIENVKDVLREGQTTAGKVLHHLCLRLVLLTLLMAFAFINNWNN